MNILKKPDRRTDLHWLTREEIKGLTFLKYPNPDPHLSLDSEGQWYFWDETEANCFGPFTMRIAATVALDEYARSL